MELSSLESVLIGIVTAGLGFYVKDVFWPKVQKNQERIDNAVIESVKKSEEKIIALEKITERHTILLGNQSGDITTLKDLYKENKQGVEKLVEVLQTVDANMKIQHNDIRVQNSEIKQVMDKSNMLIQETTNINRELLGYLKGLEKK